MADVLKKVPVREQEPKVRATNFEEVCYGYNKEEAMEEATRCLNCKNARCIQGCPVSINIPAFIAQIKDGNIEEAYKVIGQSSALPAICGRVCPQESQCESKCVRGIKGQPVGIGRMERFVADYHMEHAEPVKADIKKNGLDIWMWKYDGDKTELPAKIIFNNNGNGNNQTGNFDFVNGAVYNRDGKTNESVSTGINQVGSKKAPAKLKIYSINGVKVAEVNKVSDAEYVLAPGMYICNGKKFVIK